MRPSAMVRPSVPTIQAMTQKILIPTGAVSYSLAGSYWWDIAGGQCDGKGE